MTLSFDSARRDSPTFSSICRHLAVSWGAASVPYLIGFRSVPEPVVTIFGATAIGVVGGMLEARSLEPRARVAQPATTGRRNLTVGTPSAPPAMGRTPLNATRPTQPKRTTIDFDRYSRNTDAVELQCPRCGAFEVVAERLGAHDLDARCEVCATQWQQGPSLSFPDVAVRSWLHP